MANKTTKKDKEQPGRQSGVILIIILATFFGLGAGMTSTLVMRPFILNEVYNIPFSGEINLSQSKTHRANLVIENAKKIIIEQDTRVNNTINSAKKSIVGIFEIKKPINNTEKNIETDFDIENYYKLNDKITEGIIITSDGWILTNNFNKDFNKKYIKENYIIITNENKTYEIEDIIESGMSSYIFIRLKNAKELPVKNFSKKNNLTNGQMVVATNWSGYSYLTSVISKNNQKEIIMSSDETAGSFILSDELEKHFKNSFIFNLNNEIIGLFNENNNIVPMDYFQPVIRALLNKKEVLRPSLGVKYINLSDFAITNTKYKEGALIHMDEGIKKGSAAEEAGLKNGDIILSVDNIDINQTNNLTDIIQGYLAKEEITIIYARNEKEKIAKIILKEYEQID